MLTTPGAFTGWTLARRPGTRFHHHSGSSETSEIAQRQYTLSLIVIGAELAFLRLDLDAGPTQT
jgi:hypothetical protein